MGITKQKEKKMSFATSPIYSSYSNSPSPSETSRSATPLDRSSSFNNDILELIENTGSQTSRSVSPSSRSSSSSIHSQEEPDPLLPNEQQESHKLHIDPNTTEEGRKLSCKAERPATPAWRSTATRILTKLTTSTLTMLSDSSHPKDNGILTRTKPSQGESPIPKN